MIWKVKRGVGIIAAVLLLLPVWAQAQGPAAAAFPAKPIRLVAPFPPGGPIDLLARLVGEKLQQRWGQPVIVENRPGAGGNIGIKAVADAAPDGYTLLVVPAGNITINATLMKDLPFNWERDFTAVTKIATAPNILAVNPAVTAKSVPELIALARAQPGRLTYGSPGIGSGLHLAGELFRREAGIDILHVPYKGTTQAMNDLMGGQLSMMFGAMPTLLPQVRAGKLRALAVTSAQRASAAPELPTIAEAGLAGFDVSSWYGVMAPAATPREVVSRLQAEIALIVALPEVKAGLEAQGLYPVANRPEAFAAQIRAETARWARVIREADIKPE
jgi:tripartite-type tricarboxylate transporter receptor subunit TctC